MDLFKEPYSPSPGTRAKLSSFYTSRAWVKTYKGLSKENHKRKLVQLKMLGFND